ncbi:tyrosine-type recombinase/integrase [Heliophilum fasciatum]|uniref:Integrase n=1 Tax=Heliophilum fasciatum TaxID=35700 RepID=A0A4R2RDP5_9FIRM|nr:site-specific integrase [Heliophilum fasciatum]MCW2279297.1 integrase [Heliophilum fasciatum]TCP60458.1 integrase [Heliophilum fasciatum]
MARKKATESDEKTKQVNTTVAVTNDESTYGEGSVYFRASDKMYVAILWDVDPTTGKKKRIPCAGKTPEKAQEKREKKRVELEITRKMIMDGTYTPPKVSSGNNGPVKDITLAEWMPKWLSDYVSISTKISTYTLYETMSRVHIVPTLGSVSLRKLTTGMIQEELIRGKLESGRIRNLKDQKVGKGLSPKSIRHIYNVIRLALAQAVKEGRIDNNPALGVKLPKKRKSITKVLSKQQMDKLLAHVKQSEPRLYAAFYIASRLGLRRGELLGLRWQDVKWEHRYISVEQTVERVNRSDGKGRKTSIEFGTPKTDASAAPIPLPKDVLEVLKNHYIRIKGERLSYGRDYRDNDLITCNLNGTPMCPRQFTRRLEKYLEKAELPRVKLHSLRYFAGANILRMGGSMKHAQTLLRHKDVTTTGNIYLNGCIEMDDLLQLLERDIPTPVEKEKSFRTDSIA